MKTITLKQLKQNIYPKWTNYAFAEFMGLDNSICSKIMSGKYDCTRRSKVWVELCERVKNNFGYQLISENKFDIAANQAEKIIRNLKYEVEHKDRIIAEYEEVVKELTAAVRVMCGAKQALEKGHFVLHKYENKKKG